MALVLLAAVAACGDDFGEDPPPGPSDAEWSKSFGDEAAQTVTSVAMDELGGVYITGGFAGTTDFGGGPITAAGTSEDLFVAKLDTDGNHVWSRRFGDTGMQRGTGIAVSAQGQIVVTGTLQGSIDLAGEFLQSTSSSDIFLIALDADGEPLWGKTFAGVDQDNPRAVAVDGGGNIHIAGDFLGDVAFGGDLLFSAGDRDVFVAKFLPTGEHVWSQRFGDEDSDLLGDLAVSEAGAVAITGTSRGLELDFGGGPLPGGGGDDAFLATFAQDGGVAWAVRLGDDTPQRGTGVTYDAAANLVATGQFAGTVDFGGGQTRTSTGGVDVYAVKFAPDGGVVWTAGFGVQGNQLGGRVAASPDGEVTLVGTFDGAVDFGGSQLTAEGTGMVDIYRARLSASGAHLASSAYGGALMESVADVAVDVAGNAAFVGDFQGTIDFGFGGHATTGDMDVNPFVVKLSR
ncbi:MAG: hypothetical protein R3B72_45610 [Polyangiaceae bacterium]